MENRYFVLTGAPGAGKTTLLKALRDIGYACIDEPARDILAEQRAIDAWGVPQRGPLHFVELMLSRAIYDHRRMASHTGPVIFDRGVPDMVGYANLSGLDCPPARCAARIYRYRSPVFFLPAWGEIYATDDERKMSFEAARAFGEQLRAVYLENGYTLVELPCVTVEERVAFIEARLLAC